ncbi:hypothetical protein GCM10018952_63570 [Streptosporangium vulgare]
MRGGLIEDHHPGWRHRELRVLAGLASSGFGTTGAGEFVAREGGRGHRPVAEFPDGPGAGKEDSGRSPWGPAAVSVRGNLTLAQDERGVTSETRRDARDVTWRDATSAT